MKKSLAIQKTIRPLERMPINEWYQYIHDQVQMNENPSYFRKKIREKLDKTIRAIDHSLENHRDQLAKVIDLHNNQDKLLGEAYKILSHGRK